MPRAPRIQYPGAYYHITSRGIAKQSIYLDDNDRSFFSRILDKVIRKLDWRCNAYCLMDNHFHLLIETPEPNLSIGMKYLNGVYSQRFNVRHERVGHLMQGRYFSRLVTNDSYYYALAQYIVLNPVRAGLCTRASDWRWSSFRATAGYEVNPAFLDTGFLLDMFNPDIASARKEYESFIAGAESIDPDVARTLMKNLLKEMDAVERPALSVVFSNGSSNHERDSKIADAYLAHGYTMRQIAQHLGLSEARISRILKRRREQEDASFGV
jgi:putative transposase